jgi:hypothetical protein
MPSGLSLEELVERKRLQVLEVIRSLPIAALIWGPAPDSASVQAQARRLLRDELLKDGHLARFSEELFDPTSPYSVLIQEVAQAESHDIVFSIPGSPGSIAEIHDFARIPGVSHKIIAFLDYAWSDGYANKSLIQLQSVATCQIQLYNAGDLPNCIIDRAKEIIRRLQEFYYLAGRRC